MTELQDELEKLKVAFDTWLASDKSKPVTELLPCDECKELFPSQFLIVKNAESYCKDCYIKVLTFTIETLQNLNKSKDQDYDYLKKVEKSIKTTGWSKLDHTYNYDLSDRTRRKGYELDYKWKYKGRNV